MSTHRLIRHCFQHRATDPRRPPDVASHPLRSTHWSSPPPPLFSDSSLSLSLAAGSGRNSIGNVIACIARYHPEWAAWVVGVTATARIEGAHSYGAAAASTAVIPTTLVPLHTTKCCLTASALNSLVFPAATTVLLLILLISLHPYSQPGGQENTPEHSHMCQIARRLGGFLTRASKEHWWQCI